MNSMNLIFLPQIFIQPLWTRKKPPAKHSKVTTPVIWEPDSLHVPPNLARLRILLFGAWRDLGTREPPCTPKSRQAPKSRIRLRRSPSILTPNGSSWLQFHHPEPATAILLNSIRTYSISKPAWCYNPWAKARRNPLKSGDQHFAVDIPARGTYLAAQQTSNGERKQRGILQ